MRDFIPEVKMVGIKTVKPMKDNPRKHSAEQIAFLAEIIESMGFDQPK